MGRRRSDVLEACGLELRAWREAQDPELSQTAAAAMIGATQGAWGAWENGRKAPDGYYSQRLEELTKGRVTVASWVVPRKGTSAARAAESSTVLADVEDADLHGRNVG
jgi:transcriptional regulator with XRE-family HTH domain